MSLVHSVLYVSAELFSTILFLDSGSRV